MNQAGNLLVVQLSFHQCSRLKLHRVNLKEAQLGNPLFSHQNILFVNQHCNRLSILLFNQQGSPTGGLPISRQNSLPHNPLTSLESFHLVNQL